MEPQEAKALERLKREVLKNLSKIKENGEYGREKRKWEREKRWREIHQTILEPSLLRKCASQRTTLRCMHLVLLQNLLLSTVWAS